MKLFVSMLLLLLVSSCHIVSSKTAVANSRDLQYIYIYDYEADSIKQVDSLMLYKNLPIERSLEIYTHTDTLSKTVEGLVHIAIFKVEGQKFAVITDTASTTFYKYYKHHYKQIATGKVAMAFMIKPMQYKDFNADGYMDIWYSVPSGGFYGDDDFILFYDPETQSLVYNKEPQLRNIKVNGNTIVSGNKFWWNTYTTRGNAFLITETLIYLQGNDVYKKVLSTYNEAGALLSIDTLRVDENEW